MMLMYTYGENERVGEEKFRIIGGERIKFKYPDNMNHHYQHRDDLDLQNERYQETIVMEDTGSIRLWKNCVLWLFLDLLEVNNNLGENQFGAMEAVRPVLDFRKQIYRNLVNNPYLREDDIKLE